MQAEADRGEIGEDGRPIIPIIADTARVDANRKRIGQPPLEKAAAMTAAQAGDAAPLTAWCKQVPKPHRDLLANLLLALGSVAPGGDAVVAERPLVEGYLAAVPAQDDARILVGNLLANALVARATAPNAEDLARAVVLAKDLEAALQRPDVERHPLAHTIADTLACVRYREGQLPAAATLWQKAMTLAGAKSPELYRRRLEAAEAGDATAPLPR